MILRRSYLQSLSSVFAGLTIAGCTSTKNSTVTGAPLGKVKYVGRRNPLFITATDAFVADGVAVNGHWVKPDIENAEHFVVIHVWAKNEKTGVYFPKPGSFKLRYGENVSERVELGRFFALGNLHITYAANWGKKAGGDGVNYSGIVVQGWEAFPVKESFTFDNAVFELTVPDPPDDGDVSSWKLGEEKETTITPNSG